MTTCPSCGTENGNDARFCVACGVSLASACPRCGTELPAGARFCPSCGSALAEDLGSGRERKVVTVLFADVTGSTALGERLDPEHLREVMDAYFTAMREEIESEGGTVEKFIGDAVMAAFGVPVAHEDDPGRALRAATRMLHRLDSVNERLSRDHGVSLEIRIGVNTGEVLAATDPRPGEPMVTGDAVNAAARLQTAAEPGDILVSERTAKAVRGFLFLDLGPLDLRGKAEPVRAFRVTGEAMVAPERGVPGLRAPMIGRDAELALLRTIFERSVAEGRPNLVTIYGDAGVGKSRLTAEFLAWAEARDLPPIIVRGRCLPYGDGVTYWPLSEILKATAGVLDSDPPELALEKVRKSGRELLTPAVALDGARATAALAFTVGLEDPEFSFASLEPRQVRAELHRAWRAFFSSLAADGPVIVIIEDIHWADPAMLDILEELAERAEGPITFVCPTRPDLTTSRPSWGGGRRNFSSVAIDPLEQADAERLVGLLLAIDDLLPTVRVRILERAEGNPFFLEEIIRHLIDEGRIVHTEGRWRATSELNEVVIPDTVQGVLAARIDLLGARDKRVLQSAAVVGRVFWPGPVQLLIGDEDVDLDASLAALEHRELVLSRLGSAIQGEPEFIFKHVLARDVAYESLPRRDRARAHAAIAGWLEGTAGARRAEVAELLAYHYEEAFRGERDDVRGDPARLEALRSKGYEVLLLASEDARRRYAVRKAASLADRALAIAGEDPLLRARALEQVGSVALNDYDGQLAWHSHREAADLRAAHVPEDPAGLALTCALAVESPLRWPGSMRTVPPEAEVRRYIDLGFANVGEEDSATHVQLLTAQAFVTFGFGREREMAPEELEAAREAGMRAADMAQRLGRPDLESAALDGVGAVLLGVGRYEENRTTIARRLEIAERLDDPWELGDIYAVASWNASMLGEYDEARGRARKGFRLTGSEASGVALHCLAWEAFAEFQLGEWDAVVDDVIPRAEALLGDRREDPPYFVAHLLGTAALIHESRREEDRARRWAALLERHRDAVLSGVLERGIMATWFTWVLVRRGDLEGARDLIGLLADQPNIGIYRAFFDPVRAQELADSGRWDEVGPFLADSRAYATVAGSKALPAHLDRLEGRAALAAGDVQQAVVLLARASDAFGGLEASWEGACTDHWLAEALLAAGRGDEALRRLDTSTAVFRSLRSLPEIDRNRELGSRL